MMSALKRMRVRNRGTIVNVGSALAYRSCRSRRSTAAPRRQFAASPTVSARKSFTTSSAVHLTIVDLPAINTPQFDWAAQQMGRRAKPVAPIYAPEVAARAIFFAATPQATRCMARFLDHQAILANRIAPGSSIAISPKRVTRGQLTEQAHRTQRTCQICSNRSKVTMAPTAVLDAESRSVSWEMFTDRHRRVFFAAIALAAAVLTHRVARRLDL